MPHQIHCSLNYHFLSANDLPPFANGVKKGLFDNVTVFNSSKEPTLPVTESELSVLIAGEVQAYAAYKTGGAAQKVPYILARKLLVAKLDAIAGYVDVLSGGDASVIALAGFAPTYFGDFSKSGIPSPPQEVAVSNGTTSGSIHAECESFGPQHQYGCIVTEAVPLSADIKIDNAGHLLIPANQPYNIFFDLNHSRKKHFVGLKAGVEYHVYFYVVSNYGVSLLSAERMVKSL